MVVVKDAFLKLFESRLGFIQVPGDIEYGMNLVGAKIKVWWPDDKQ